MNFFEDYLILYNEAPSQSPHENADDYKARLQETKLRKADAENGRKEMECLFVDGRKEGLQRQWYETGIIQWETEFINGKVNGFFKSYNQFGKIISEGNYKDGKKHGLSHFYFDDGSVITDRYQNGEVLDEKDSKQ